MNQLLALPWHIQIAVVGGYFGYVIAYSGKRGAHKPTDTLAIILCFGGISVLALDVQLQLFGSDWAFSSVIFSVVAIGVAIVGAIIWRRILSKWVGAAIRYLSSGKDDGLFFGWESLIQEEGLEYSQVNVTLKNGRILESYPLGNFNNLPNGPCLIGGDGSIALYVTHITEVGEDRRETNNLLDEAEGARITFVPASEISELDFRRAFRKSRRK